MKLNMEDNMAEFIKGLLFGLVLNHGFIMVAISR